MVFSGYMPSGGISGSQVVVIDSCSVNSCNLGVSVGGGELGVFLLYYLLSPLKQNF